MRRNRHRWMTALLACLLLTGQLGVPALASDLEGHLHQQVMEKWSALGWFTGDGGGVYRPDDGITRAEFMALVNRMKGYWTASADVGQYTDVPPAAWYAPIVAAALHAGYITGRGNGIMAPLDRLTRQEALVMLARVENLPAPDRTAAVEGIASWAADGVTRCAAAGLLPFSQALTQPMTRSQAVFLLDCALEQVRHYPLPGVYGPKTGRATAAGAEISAGGVTLQNMDISGDLVILVPAKGDVIRLVNLTVGGQLRITGDRDRVILERCTLAAQPEEKPENTTEAPAKATPPPSGDSGSSGPGMPSPSPVYAGHDEPDKTVPWGTSLTLLHLPDQVTLRASTGITAVASAVWDTSSYRSDTPGSYTLTARLTSAAAWAPATVSIRVTVNAAVTVTEGCHIDTVTVKSSESPAQAAARLPEALTLLLSDGSRITVTLVWSWDAYDQMPGRENTLTAEITGLPYYVVPPVITATVAVAADDTPVATAILLHAEPGTLRRPANGASATATVTVTVTDQFGSPLDVPFSVSLKRDYPGVSCSERGGVHTVIIDDSCTDSVIALVGAVTGTQLRGEALIHIFDTLPIAASIDFGSADNVIILTAGGAERQLSAVVRDQNGAAMPGKAATYSLETDTPGVTLTPEGLLRVQPTVAPGTALTVTAAYEALTPAQLTLTVTREASGPARLVPSGPQAVTIPATGSVQVSYTAAVLDQFGEVISRPVGWTLEGAAPGVTLSGDGTLTVSAEAVEDTRLTLLARVGDVVQSYSVVLAGSRAAAPNATLSLEAGALVCTLLPYSADALARIETVSVILESGDISTGFDWTAPSLSGPEAGLTRSLLPYLACFAQHNAVEPVTVKLRARGKTGYADSDWRIVAEIALTREKEPNGIGILQVEDHGPSHYLLATDTPLAEDGLYAVFYHRGLQPSQVYITSRAHPAALEVPYLAEGATLTGFAVSRMLITQEEAGYRLQYTPLIPHPLS